MVSLFFGRVVGRVAFALFFFLVVSLTVPITLAQVSQADSLVAKYTLASDESVQVSYEYRFTQGVVGETVVFYLDGSPENVRVRNDSDSVLYTVQQVGSRYQLSLRTMSTGEKLVVNYTVMNAVFSRGGQSHFFTDIPSEISAKSVAVSVHLPKGYGVVEENTYPRGFVTSSDGTHIILAWDGLTTKDTLVSVKYVKLAGGSFLWGYVFIMFLFVLLPVLYVVQRWRSKGEFLKGFSADEKKAIMYLQHRPNAWQKGLEDECQFSRVKTTRVLKKLEAKGLISKEGQGRINKIVWKG